jgi:hypothetical protein
MRIESPHRFFYLHHVTEKAGGNKNGRAIDAQPIFNSQVHHPRLF